MNINTLKNALNPLLKKERHINTTKKSMADFRQYRGMCDLLNYLVQLDDCTILHKDGAISRHYSYIGPDLDSSTSNDMDYVSDTWATAFSFLGNGWMVETNVASQQFIHETASRNFPEIVSALIDDERRLQYDSDNYFKTTYYLSITYKPESMIESKLRRFAIDNDSKESGFDEQLSYFNKVTAEYLGYLERALHKIEPLTGNQLTTFLYYCETQSNQKLAKPDLEAVQSLY